MSADTVDHPSITEPLQEAVETCADTESLESSRSEELTSDRAKWQQWIDDRLLPWLTDPGELEDEGFDEPTRTIVRLAIDYAEKFRDEGLTPPSAIIADPNGSIIFILRNTGSTEKLYFWDDGKIEYLCFVGTDIVERREI